ncbi:Histone-binding protein N1/N2 [Toxocara canis]|uniref:Histone-binding protein N1/N2 n=1 Tax=Toxocara canis TaxID=6265 RepID=A0A0B2VT65_TOXCA|nr:Histone-binding protein N1/N2 [Toxocara canis]
MMTPAVVVDNCVNEEESMQSKKERMDSLFADGKRAYIVGDLATASDKLGEASGLAVELYGEFALEAFYPHYYYGKTMLEMASVEDQVFTNALQNTTKTDEDGEEEDEGMEEKPVGELIGNPEELNEREQEEIAEKVAGALEENAATLERRQLPTEPKDASDQVGEREQEEIAEKVAGALEENAATLERRQLPTEPKDASDQEKQGAESVSPAKDKQPKEEQNAEIEDEKGLNLSGTSSEGTEDGLRVDEIAGADEAAKGAVEADEAIEEGGEERDDSISEKVDNKTNRKHVEIEGDVRQAAVEDGERREESVQEDEIDKAEDSDAQDDEIEPVQLAWEALEVARTICDKHIDEEGWKEKKADVLLALGECSIQNASYKQAMEDITLCVEMYKSACEPSDRRIAEACFQKARVYALDEQFEMAAETYTTVKQLLESRLGNKFFFVSSCYIYPVMPHIDEEGWKEKKADVLLALGECSIQNASYKQAMEDITLCVEMYKSACEPSDRRIAEACFQKARVYALDEQFEMAAETYTTVKQLLESRLVLTEKELAEASDAEKKRAVQKEMDSLKDLIPEIQIKIDDSRESALNAEQARTAKREKAIENGTKLSDSTSNVTEGADDITKLVRKKAVKRAAGADEPIVEEQNKKAKCVAEEMVNGQKTTIDQ